MESKDISDLDQAFAAMGELADNLPIMWGKMFNQCLKEGFTTDQSLELVRTYIISQGVNSINWNNK